MHKDLKDRSERSQTNMAALGRDNERLDPSVLTVLARVSERCCQTFFIRSITTKIEMTCISRTENKNKTYFSLHRFVILFFDEVFILINKLITVTVCYVDSRTTL